ncbi:MAG: rRNA maturation RNase YbeY [Parcubacteria group bacterium RIFCSPLOWO2_01_FULL_48_18]|nr:MAG: rRNA maturation RNase YbeY [Parcubacteria group bacterium RIFCSPHIGHO2_02_FULL_48_10b]OHB22018.1 MAG: rRNA maturation RNase YbeY [Parcubacteria group bacterium RIFCSPLOWO2_01_FULL_48_18]
MDALRKRFRIDHPPSVLSFLEPKHFKYPRDYSEPLGEIVLCRFYLKQEARKFKMAVRDWEAKLIAHGVLHLLGYDHATEKAANRMENIERIIGS